VGLLAGGVAHEFNNLLQAIGGYTNCAMEGLLPDNQRYSDLDQVRKATDRAATLTRELLGFSRRRKLQPVSLDPNEVVDDLVKMLRPLIGAHIDLKTVFGDDVGSVYADPGELHQILLNLCLNARDAMPSGGALVLKTESEIVGETLWQDRFQARHGRYVVFSITDTGCGIPAEARQHIFEPFFTTKEVGKGTGLGLAMVYGSVQQHKGAIHVESEPGHGTTIKIYLPAGSRIGAIETDSVPRRLPPRGTETILLAEDEPLVQRLATRILERAGYSVLLAADGHEVLDLFEANRERIALVILDAIMPRLTGPQVYYRIKERFPDIKVIFSTGYDPEAAETSLLAQESVRWLEKPFDEETLLRTVREALDERAPSDNASGPRIESTRSTN
jgi:two-component system, cell cycle sensor histidine kinase and response regulator CckA